MQIFRKGCLVKSKDRMKKLLSALSFISLFFVNIAQAQDSLSVHTEIAMRGRRQTGNLDQFGINPSVKTALGSRAFNTELTGNYQFLKVNDFTSINDLWVNGIFRLIPDKRIYPFAITYYGFADSYKIDQSLIGGAGAGINLLSDSPHKTLQVHLFGGYADVDFAPTSSVIATHSSAAIGSFVRGDFSIARSRFDIHWEFHSYHSVSNSDFYGASNLIDVRYALIKGLHLSASHSTIFNNTSNEGIARTNTLLMFGLAFRTEKVFRTN